MLSLSEPPRDSIVTSKGKFQLDLMFNTVLDYYEMIERDDLTDLDKIEAGWLLFVGDGALNFNSEADWTIAIKAMADLSDYIARDPYQDRDEASTMLKQQKAHNIKPTQWYSYSKDADAIFASFLFDYSIDLVDQRDHLRWEKFRALFNNLSPKSPLMRIVSIRQTNLADLEGQALADMADAQNYYALDKSVDQVNDALGSMFDMLKLQAVNR